METSISRIQDSTNQSSQSKPKRPKNTPNQTRPQKKQIATKEENKPPQDPSKIFKGPYITHKPEIKVFDLTDNDTALILATDGLWDEIKPHQILQIIESKSPENPGKLLNQLLESALENAAKRCKIGLEDIKNISTRKRRKYHDDISIIYVDLAGQAGSGFFGGSYSTQSE